MPEAELKESGYNGFERFLYMFLIPFVFTAALLGVMMQVFFGYDVLGGLQKAGNSIPGISMLVPDPKADPEAVPPAGTPGASGTAGNGTGAGGQVEPDAASAARIAELETKLNEAAAGLAERDNELTALQEELKQAQEKLNVATISSEEYEKQIRQLSDMYAKMTPSRAAPILESMTLSEAALILKHMKMDVRGKLMERLNPKTAADLTALLKDSVSVRDLEIAALQERLKVAEDKGEAKGLLTTTELGTTFAGMESKGAAELLLAMYSDNQAKTLGIIAAMDSASRSKVLEEMAKLNKTTAASISARLGG